MSRYITPNVILEVKCLDCGGTMRTLGCEDCEDNGIPCRGTVCIDCGEPGVDLPEDWDGK